MTADLRALLGRTAFAAAIDADLLSRYAAERDDVAFAELVHRHAPAVYSACRRFLSRPADLDDAFQAVFLLLSQKAGSIADPTRLTGWLCGAAGRIARKVRDRSAKRSITEKSLDTVPEPLATPTDPTDLKAVLDEELARLPPAYREAVLLCDVGGLARRTAAKRLGVPESTLSNRLTRARAMLGSRLLRRGVALGAGLSLTSVAIATVPAKLVTLTVSRITTGTVPTDLASLAPAGVPAMSTSRIVLVLVVGVVTVGLTALGLTASKPVPQANRATARQPFEPPDGPDVIDGESAFHAVYSPDGKVLAVAEVDNLGRIGPSRITLFDTATWKVLHRLTDQDNHPDAATFSADGTILFTCGREGGVQGWDVTSGERVKSKAPDSGKYAALRRSPDGKRLAAYLMEDDAEGLTRRLQLFDAITGEPLRTLTADEPLRSGFAFSPDGERLAANCSGEGEKGFRGVIEWDANSGEVVKRIPAVPPPDGSSRILSQLAYSPDGKQLIVTGGAMWLSPDKKRSWADGGLWVFDRDTGKPAKTLMDDVVGEYAALIALSPDGTKLYAAVSMGGQLMRVGESFRQRHEYRCWGTAAWELDSTRPNTPQQMADVLVVSPDGKHLAVSRFHQFLLLDADTGEPVRKLMKKRW